MEFETDRLLIKHGQISDYVKVHEYDFNYLQGTQDIFKYVKRDPNEVISWFKNYNSMEEYYDSLEKEKTYEFLLYLKDSNEPIGEISFDRFNEKLKSLEIACWIHPKFWGKGYAKEAIIVLMNYIYSLGYDNIVYSYDEGNERSKKLSDKIGFNKLNTIDTYNYFGEVKKYINVMSKDDYKNRNLLKENHESKK